MVRRTFIELAEYVIGSFKTLGFTLPPDCRFLMVRDLLANSKGTFFETDPLFPMIAEGMRDLQIMAFVFEQAEKTTIDPIFKRNLKKALKDSVLPQIDKENSHGRDTQFELYIASICINAGLLPVTFNEPDVTCVVKGVECSIAAKRPRNFDRIKTAITKGASQILEWKRPGIIAFDTCVALNPDNVQVLRPTNDQPFVDFHRALINYRIGLQLDDIKEWVKDTGTLGIVFHDSILRVDERGELEQSGMTIGLKTIDGDEKATALYQAFCDGYFPGLPEGQELP